MTEKPEKPKQRLMVALISGHAFRRFKERWRPLDVYDEIPKTESEWSDKFRGVLVESTKIQLSRVARVRQLLNHNFEEATYFSNPKYGLQFVLIQLDSNPVVRTVIWKGYKYRSEGSDLSDEEGAQ